MRLSWGFQAKEGVSLPISEGTLLPLSRDAQSELGVSRLLVSSKSKQMFPFQVSEYHFFPVNALNFNINLATL